MYQGLHQRFPVPPHLDFARFECRTPKSGFGSSQSNGPRLGLACRRSRPDLPRPLSGIPGRRRAKRDPAGSVAARGSSQRFEQGLHQAMMPSIRRRFPVEVAQDPQGAKQRRSGKTKAVVVRREGGTGRGAVAKVWPLRPLLSCAVLGTNCVFRIHRSSFLSCVDRTSRPEYLRQDPRIQADRNGEWALRIQYG